MNSTKKASIFKVVWGWIVAGREKRKLLDRHNWYRNMAGGWTHPHAMDYMTIIEIAKLNPKQLEYKLRHGSRAVLPEGLK